jgi:hypothetical protein
MPWSLSLHVTARWQGLEEDECYIARGSLGIDKVDQRDWGPAGLGSQRRQLVEGLFRRRAEDLISLSCGETRGLVPW